MFEAGAAGVVPPPNHHAPRVYSLYPQNGSRMRPLFFALSLATTPLAVVAQQSKPLEVGAVAPDFSMKGATRYGVLANPVRLSDFKGKTVVLAFFYKARTGG
jgi:AhpC/TSA family